MIEVDNLSVHYGSEHALENVSVTIEANTICTIIGPSGCGKTTLLYALAGIRKPTDGSIRIDGSPLSGVRQDTGLILQDYGLFPWKTVRENIGFPLQTRNYSRDVVNDICDKTMMSLGMTGSASKYPSQLSGGQKQRVAIGRTLALKPNLLLMDEASSALDAMTKESLQDLIMEQYRQTPMTIVAVTHSIEEAVFLGQRILIMRRGQIIHDIPNPLSGTEGLRDSLAFYEQCLKVRDLLNE